MAKIRPLDDRVVVEPLEAEEKTAGGILLPDTAKEKPQRGKVICGRPRQAARQRRARRRWPSQVGDEVLFGKYAGTEVKVDGKEVKILRESDILAKIVEVISPQSSRQRSAAGSRPGRTLLTPDR